MKDNRCTVPFDGHIQINLDTGSMAPCCKIKQVTIENKNVYTDSLIDLRQSIINNERNSLCEECWKLDDLGGPSFRRRASTHFNKDIDWTKLSVTTPITKIQVIFSDKCNLQCSYCGPVYSSMWQMNLNKFKDHKKYVSIEKKNTDLYELLDLEQLMSIQVMGGEPLIEKKCIDFFMNLSFNPKRKIIFITNLSYGGGAFSSLMNIIERHPNTSVFCSLDEIGENPSRKYLNWELWQKNFHTLADNLQERRKAYSDAILSIKVTISIFNVYKLSEILNYCLKMRYDGYRGITFELNSIATHDYFSIVNHNIDKTKLIKLVPEYENLLTSWEKNMIVQINNLITNSKPNQDAIENFNKFLKIYNS